jgi:LmbE family N-acetylglucosaminyl deacetylase
MRILWIGAHPDDEMFVAPWLARLRVTAGAKISFLVATRGERGDRRRIARDGRDFGSVREAEMRAAAATFDAGVHFLGWRDGCAAEPQDVLRIWAGDAGGRKNLRDQLRNAVNSLSPDWIVTFDRRHGCTWHADHRALGTLVQSLALPIPTTLAESRITYSDPLRVEPGVSTAEAIPVRDTWDSLTRDMACHRSQFRDEAIELFRNAPDEQRVVWLRHAPPASRLRYLGDNVSNLFFRTKSFIRDRLPR